jgi:hypothetical protein
MEQSMSNVMRKLAVSGLAAVAGALVLGFSGTFGAGIVEAQSPPTPPARFAGSVTVDGAPVAAGTVITAQIGSATCGSTSTFTEAGQARYVLDVPALEPNAAANCGTDGATVVFFIGALRANETGSWRNFDLNLLNLTATTPVSPTPTATVTGTPGTATPVATPRAPTTGTGTIDSSEGSSSLFLALGIGAVALAAAGAATAVRRSR